MEQGFFFKGTFQHVDTTEKLPGKTRIYFHTAHMITRPRKSLHCTMQCYRAFSIKGDPHGQNAHKTAHRCELSLLYNLNVLKVL
jgi:hypothetical protein